MARYRKVDPRVWNDDKFKGFKDPQKLAWLYLLTGPDANAIGLYFLPLDKMATDLCMKRPIVRQVINYFEHLGMVRWDPESQLMWLPRWIEYNAPAGTNQARGYISIAQDYLPHRFARAFLIVMTAVLQSQPDQRSILSQKQAILIRDALKCVYCGKELTEMKEVELDQIIPRAKVKGKGPLRSDELVAACRECHSKKGSQTAEEFGYPFVLGGKFSVGEALFRLVWEEGVRDRFRKLYHGLPPQISEIDELVDLFTFRTPSERRKNAVPEPLERRPNSGAVSRSSEQEQRAGAESRRGATPRRPSRKAPAEFKPDFEWAKKARPDLDVEFEAAVFLDHEFKTSHSDWPATWRNWIRRAEPKKRAGRQVGQSTEKPKEPPEWDAETWATFEKLHGKEAADRVRKKYGLS